MIDIKTKFEDVIRNDATLQGLMGGTPQDPRSYPYYQGEAKITPQQPAYMTYSFIDPMVVTAVSMPVFTFAIWTREGVLAERILQRMRDLFNQKIHITAAPNSRRLYTKVLQADDAYQQEPRYAGKRAQISASWSTV